MHTRRTKTRFRTISLAAALSAVVLASLLGIVRGDSSSILLWPEMGVPVTQAPLYQGEPQIASDGEGGAIVAWMDCRPTSVAAISESAAPAANPCAQVRDIYAQRLNTDGQPQWAADGIAAYRGPGFQMSPLLVSDGKGGAVVAWTDWRDAKRPAAFAQRLDSAGKAQWNPAGVLVSLGGRDEQLLDLVADGEGGAYAVWVENRSQPTGGSDLFAMRVGLDGALMWPAPITVSAAPGDQGFAQAVADGAGGLLVVWIDTRSPVNTDLYVQRLSSEGAPSWANDGVALADAPGAQLFPLIAADGEGGAYVTWYDYRAGGANSDVYMQRIGPDGAPAWAADMPLASDPGMEEHPTALVPDGSGGAVVVLSRGEANSQDFDVLAQRVDRDGRAQWGAAPLPVATWQGRQDFGVAWPDGQGGVFVTWMDAFANHAATHIWAQHVGPRGDLLWAGYGMPMAAAVGGQSSPTLIGDGDSGFIIAWMDFRNAIRGSTIQSDIFAQRAADGDPHYFLPLIAR